MALLPDWASLEDFATLFQYFWHRDFPLGQGSPGARRSDWTIHIGVAVRSVGDLMGLVTRFEIGGRKDAVLRSSDGDLVAIEWEWEGVRGNELSKLKGHKVFSVGKDDAHSLSYAVLIAYSDSEGVERDLEYVRTEWEGAPWPLLLIIIDWSITKALSSGRDFASLTLYKFYADRGEQLRKVPALPWNLVGSSWHLRMLGQELKPVQRLV